MNPSLTLAFADLSFLDPFIDQTRYVSAQLFGWQVNAGRPYAKAERLPNYHVTGAIQLRGDVQGAVALSLQRELACLMASRLLRKDILCVGDDVADAVGEFVNMVVGRASAGIRGGHARLGLPEILVGRQRPIAFPATVHPLVVEMDTAVGSFTLEVGLRETAKQEPDAGILGAAGDSSQSTKDTLSMSRPLSKSERNDR